MSLGLAFLGGALASGVLAYNTSEEEQRRRNAVLEARKAGIREQRKHEKELFEIRTFSNYYAAEQAGTSRIAQQMALGAKGGTQGLRSADMFRVGRDEWLGRKVESFKDRQAQKALADLDAQKMSPERAGWQAALTSFIPLATKAGGHAILDTPETSRGPASLGDPLNNALSNRFRQAALLGG